MKNIDFQEPNGYLTFFKLTHHPFPVAPDDENFYMSSQINEILLELAHGVMSRKGFMVLTGDIGLGKTTIGRRIIRILSDRNIETAMVLHTSFRHAELIREINRDFGIKTGPVTSSKHMFGDQLNRLNRFLLDRYRKKKNCAIIIDDAQNLNRSSLELVRMISNLEANQQKLVQILLIGQPELLETLNTTPLRQLKSRIVIQKKTFPLTLSELKQYLMFKLNAAGNNGLITLEKGAIRCIYKVTNGNFRQLNLLMDRALYVGFLHGTRLISRSTIRVAQKDLVSQYESYKKIDWRLVPVGGGFFLGLVLLGALTFLHLSGGFEQSRKASQNIAAFQLTPPGEILKPDRIATLENRVMGDLLNKAEIITESVQDAYVPAEKKREGPVHQFLKAYSLLKYEDEVIRALETGEMMGISEKIFKKTGYMWIQSETLSDTIKNRYGILAHSADKGNKRMFSLFWRPGFSIDKFYYSYKGKEIFDLQKLLARNNFYHDHVDGIVGKNLMTAVLKCQRQFGLSLTGFPDMNTLFYLYHHKEGE